VKRSRVFQQGGGSHIYARYGNKNAAMTNIVRRIFEKTKVLGCLPGFMLNSYSFFRFSMLATKKCNFRIQTSKKNEYL